MSERPQPTRLCLKRIMEDHQEFERDKSLAEMGIYVHRNEENLLETYALIIGPDGGPYQGGFYIFRLNFPPDYPFSPPRVKMLTQCAGASDGDRVRLHPHFYTDGNVCLSILNTWSGLEWHSIMSLRSLLVTILSIFSSEYPYRDEPGMEGLSKDNPKVVAYNRIIEYTNLKIVCECLNQIDDDSTVGKMFGKIVKRHFITHYKEYYQLARGYLNKYGDMSYASPYEDYKKAQIVTKHWNIVKQLPFLYVDSLTEEIVERIPFKPLKLVEELF